MGSFLRSFTFGHVRQLDAVASRFLVNLNRMAPLLGDVAADEFVNLDVDDTSIEVDGYQKQGSGYGYSGVCGLNALVASVSTKGSVPFIAAQRLRKGSANSARGAKKLVTEAGQPCRAQNKTAPNRRNQTTVRGGSVDSG